MTLKISTGLRNKMLDTGSLKSIMALGFINIYAGTVPATADAALDASNVLLSKVSNNSTATGINMAAAAADGTLQKLGTEVWSGVNAAAGTATFYRHVAPGDDGTNSVVQPRLQGAVALAGGEMNLSSTALASGATQTIDYYVVAAPTL